MDNHYSGNQYHRWRHFPIVLIFFAIALGCNQPPEQPPAQPASQPVNAAQQPASPLVIVALGNSLTAGLGVDESQSYPYLLETKLHADGYDVKVINAGVSGETSSGARSRLNWVISGLNPDIVILETGANDGLRGIDPNLLRDNLDRIITVLQNNDIDVILAGMRMPPNLGPEFTHAFAAVYPAVARTRAIALIPFFLENVAGRARLNQADGMHPNANGYKVVVNTLYPYVKTAVDNRVKPNRDTG